MSFVRRSRPAELIARFLVALLAVFVFTAGGVGYAFWFANDRVNKIPVAETGDAIDGDVDPGEPANFLIIGSDTRAFVDSDLEEEQFGNAQEQSGQRSDTMMVAHVDPDSGESVLVSFPRDLWVDIPGHGESKLNAAFALGGPELAIKTIEQNFDLPINHYLEVDFAGFQAIVESIGSVRIFFPTAARDTVTGLQVDTPGCVALEGTQALAYVRSRYYEYRTAEGEWRADPTADIGRIRRQQYFIRSLMQEAIEKSARDLRKAVQLVDKVVPKLRRDASLSYQDLVGLADAFRGVDAGGVEMLTIPADLDRSADGQSILVVRDDDAAPMLEMLRSFSSGSAPAEPVVPDVDPATVSIAVQNGAGVQGAAGEALAEFVRAGFAGAGATNADRADYEVTEIRYRSGERDAALVVQSYLAAGGELAESDDTGGADVVVVLGRDYDGVDAPVDSGPGGTGSGGTGSGGTGSSVATTATTGVANPGSTPGVTVPVTEAGRPLVGCG